RKQDLGFVEQGGHGGHRGINTPIGSGRHHQVLDLADAGNVRSETQPIQDLTGYAAHADFVDVVDETEPGNASPACELEQVFAEDHPIGNIHAHAGVVDPG